VTSQVREARKLETAVIVRGCAVFTDIAGVSDGAYNGIVNRKALSGATWIT
jgi:hypothetical protein